MTQSPRQLQQRPDETKPRESTARRRLSRVRLSRLQMWGFLAGALAVLGWRLVHTPPAWLFPPGWWRW